ncbi:MAG: DUF929 family protein [Sulfolobus sp.]
MLQSQTSSFTSYTYITNISTRPPLEFRLIFPRIKLCYGLQMIKSSMPQWVYNIVYYYEIESKLVNVGNGSVAFYAHHLVTICIITGTKGTWMFILYPNPLTPLGILKDLNATSFTPSQAVKEASNLLNEINIWNSTTKYTISRGELERDHNGGDWLS